MIDRDCALRDYEYAFESGETQETWDDRRDPERRLRVMECIELWKKVLAQMRSNRSKVLDMMLGGD